MKVIIAGTRDFHDYDVVCKAIANSWYEITEVVSGGATGVDALGERWGKERGLPVTVFPAQWQTYGKKAGPIRNAEMAEYADALVAVVSGPSPGTRGMIKISLERGLKVYVHEVKR